MTKAEAWARFVSDAQAEAHRLSQQPGPTFRVCGVGGMRVIGQARCLSRLDGTGKVGLYLYGPNEISVEDAIAFARWIVETFEAEEDLPALRKD